MYKSVGVVEREWVYERESEIVSVREIAGSINVPVVHLTGSFVPPRSYFEIPSSHLLRCSRGSINLFLPPSFSSRTTIG